MTTGWDAEARRQQALVAAINGAAPPGDQLRELAGVAAGAGLLAYRRNAQALSQRALEAVFPRLQQWLGAEQFGAMAWAFWRRSPPQQGDLGAWGQDLPEFLAAQPGMESEALALARLEWALHQAERAADAEWEAASLALLGALPPERLRLQLRPGLQLLQPEKLLVWRAQWQAHSQQLAADQACFIEALLQPDLNLAQALEQCLAHHPDFDFSAWLQAALAQGWLQAVRPCQDTQA